MGVKIIRCRSCGAPLPAEATECEFCGRPVLLKTKPPAGTDTKATNSIGRRVIDALQKPRPFDEICGECKRSICFNCSKLEKYLLSHPEIRKCDMRIVDVVLREGSKLCRIYSDYYGFTIDICLSDSYMKARFRRWESRSSFVKAPVKYDTFQDLFRGIVCRFDYELMTRSHNYAEVQQIVDDFIDNVVNLPKKEMGIRILKIQRSDIVKEDFVRESSLNRQNEKQKNEITAEYLKHRQNQGEISRLKKKVIRRSVTCVVFLLYIILHHYIYL